MKEELNLLLAAYLGAESSSEQRTQLLARLDDDPEFRRQVAAELHLRGLLQLTRSSDPRWSMLEDELQNHAADSPGDARTSDELAGEEHLMVMLDQECTKLALARRIRWGLAISVSLSLIVGAIALLRNQERPAPAPDREVANVKPRASGPVAVLVESQGARWKDRVKPPEKGEVIFAERLRLDSGQITLSIVNGVLLTIEGPADVELNDPYEIDCRLGNLRAIVPPGAEGFSVITPRAIVVDLGTEFAVNVSADQKLNVHVFRGAADLGLLGKSGNVVRAETLPLEETVEVSGDSQVQIQKESQSSFVEMKIPEVPALPVGPAYRRAVMDSKPWAYWQLEKQTGNYVPNSSASEVGLQVFGDPKFVTNGDGVGACVFSSTSGQPYLIADRDWILNPSAGEAVELWFLADRYHQATLFGLLGDPDGLNHGMLVELSSMVAHGFRNALGVRALDRSPPGQFGGDNLYSQSIYRPNAWHHLVVQRLPGKLEIYLDGELATQATNTDREALPLRPIFGRLTSVAPEGVFLRPFVGRLAELALYDRALHQQEILEHYQKGNRIR